MFLAPASGEEVAIGGVDYQDRPRAMLFCLLTLVDSDEIDPASVTDLVVSGRYLNPGHGVEAQQDFSTCDEAHICEDRLATLGKALGKQRGDRLRIRPPVALSDTWWGSFFRSCHTRCLGASQWIA